ncbi:MAG: leucyl/phenylalanyl-tRNA--protein transferase [Actinomycetota bacterium]
MPAALPPSEWDRPDPAAAAAGEELLAVGADLAPATLIDAYGRGLFPMEVERDGPIGWWSPDPRGVIPLDGLKISRSLRRSCRRMRTTVDHAFDEVMAACGDPRRPHGWITPAFRSAYGELHRLGRAHSVEVWQDDALVGGVYGVQVGGLFAGESMFHRVRDASKVALVTLVEALGGDAGAQEGRLLDVQWATPHLLSMGAVAMPRPDYLSRLRLAISLSPAIP